MFCLCLLITILFFFFFFNDTATTEIYTLSLHDALPIYPYMTWREYTVEYPDLPGETLAQVARRQGLRTALDRKSTRLNSSHVEISYAVFCLKKKNKTNNRNTRIQKKTNKH